MNKKEFSRKIGWPIFLATLFLLSGCLKSLQDEYYGITVTILLETELDDYDLESFTSISPSDLTSSPTLLKAVNELIDNLSSNGERSVTYEVSKEEWNQINSLTSGSFFSYNQYYFEIGFMIS